MTRRTLRGRASIGRCGRHRGAGMVLKIDWHGNSDGCAGWILPDAIDHADGSSRAPLKAFPPTIAAGARFEVRSGLYQGPFVFPPGVVIEARGEVVFHAEGLDAVVVEGQGELALKGVSIQGGGVGLRARGNTVLDQAHFSGHHALAIEAVGPVTAKDCVLKGLSSESKGIMVNHSALSLERVTFTGAFGRAIEAVHSAVNIRATRWEGPRIALHAVDSLSVVLDSKAHGGAGPAFFAARGALTLGKVSVEGHEYAVQTGTGTVLDVDGFSSKRALLAAFGLVETQARLNGLELEAAGSLGGIQAIGCALELTHSKIVDSTSTAVLARRGTLRLDDVRISGVRAEVEGNGSRSLGDAVHLRDVTASLKNLTVSDVEGSAVYATAGAKVTIDHLISERAGEGVLLVERNSQVEANSVQSTGTLAPAVVVLEGASLKIDSLVVHGSEVPLWAECGQHVSVTIRSMYPAPQTQKLGPCVTIQPSRAAPASHQ